MLICVQPSLSDSDDLEEMERLRKEHIEALREIKRLQVRRPRSSLWLHDAPQRLESTSCLLVCTRRTDFLFACVHTYD